MMPSPSTWSGRSRRVAAAVTATVLASLTALGAPAAPAATRDPVLEVPAVLETTPSESDRDSMDDPAIWVDPTDPSRSVIIGADHGDNSLTVYDLTGQHIQRLELRRANDVDLRDGFSLGGVRVPLVALAGGGRFAFFKLDPATRQLTNVTAGGDSVTMTSATGVCMYHSPVSSHYYAFVTLHSGVVNQYRLDGHSGLVDPELVRTIDIEPQPTEDSVLEACAADDRGRSLFVGEHDWSLWRFDAEPTDPAGVSDRIEVDSDVAAGGHFTADIEGITVLNLPNGEGFLFASSQGDSTFNLYRSTAPYEFIRKFRVVAGDTADGCDHTDGIEAVAGNFGSRFPYGFFVCQDNKNTAPNPGNMNFKLVRLEDILPEVVTATATTTTTTTRPSPPPGPHQPTPPTTAPELPVAGAVHRSGYWMLGATGQVFAFGDARHHGQATVPAPVTAVDIELTPSGEGYWVLDDRGGITAHGDAALHGALAPAHLRAGERVTSLSATRSGQGYWVFTTFGRTFAFGDATHLGDMAGTRLNGPVLDSILTPSGRGYYMVASDGGIFSFGDARFLGSMGGTRLNAPVQSLVPDPDGVGYWLVAADGGIFAFDAPFRGSMGDKVLNRPVTGMVPFGNGYLMVAADGGIFNFSDKAFHGSLGDNPPAEAIIAVAALR